MRQNHGCGAPVGSVAVTDLNGARVVVLGLQDDGTYTISALDENGVVRAEMGQLGDDHIGFRTLLPDGVTELFRTDERGMISPPMAVTMIQRLTGGDDSVPITSATFDDPYTGRVPSVVHSGLLGSVDWATDAATTGEMQFQLWDQVGPTLLATSATKTLAAASSGVATLSWLHGLSLPTGVTNVRLYARRTGGAGNVNIARPRGLYFVGPDGMTANGGTWA